MLTNPFSNNFLTVFRKQTQFSLNLERYFFSGNSEIPSFDIQNESVSTVPRAIDMN